MMNKSKLLRAAAGCLIAAGLFTFTACSQQTAAAAQTASGADSQAQGGQIQNGQTAIYGKVTAVDGSKITLALGTFNRGERQDGASGSGSAPQGSRPAGSSRRGAVSGSGGQNGRPGGGQMADLLTMTGESKTIEITDTDILTKQSFGGFGGGNRQGRSSGGQTNSGAASSGDRNSAGRGMPQGTAASLSDIKVGTLLRVSYDASGKMTAVQILGSAESSSSSSQSN